VQMLFKWRHHVHGTEEWDPSMRFSDDASSQPRDFLTMDERDAIREAALEYGSVPGYANLSPAARDRWKSYLAQRFEKPKSEVSPDDWERANGWKIPSLVCVSLDAGLRPVEVARAQTTWVDIENCLLRIPKEESSKSHENWVVGITERTATILRRWLKQRRTYEQYDDTEDLWYTRQGNSYRSSALKYVLEQLCEIADIDTDNRQMSWYAIRHSVGTYMTREEDLAAAQAQLRHKSPETTMQYDQTPVEDRRDALNRM
jgi:integrase